MATLGLTIAEVGLLAGIVLVFSTAGGQVSRAVVQAAERLLEGSKDRPIPQLAELERWALRLAELEARVEMLPSIWEGHEDKQRAAEERITKRIAKARRDGIIVDDRQPDPTDAPDPRELRGLPGEETQADVVSGADDIGEMIFQQRMRGGW